jgi:Leucine-rich repeat (LRR) protein
MISLPESIRQLASLRFLGLLKCNSISMLPEWLGDLKSLESIRILDCNKIRSMPSSVQQLKKLQKLCIAMNPELKQWCEYEENRKKLAHVKDIVSYTIHFAPCCVYGSV